jgi:hypothetical protein
LNCVLALAGAPVRAARLQISPLQIGCSISVDDSLLQAKPRFPSGGGAPKLDTGSVAYEPHPLPTGRDVGWDKFGRPLVWS